MQSSILLIGILSIGSSLMMIMLSLLLIANYYYISKAKDEFTGRRYVAVVLTNKTFRDEIFIYLSGVMFLVMYLKKNKISFKLMKKFNIEKFKEFIYDANCYGLYILGHGSRHSLRIGKSKKEILDYCSFKGAPKKEFVEQLHCSHLGGESLADTIAPNNPSSFVPNGYRYAGENLLRFIRLYKPSLKMWIILLPIILASEIIDKLAKLVSAFLTIPSYFYRCLSDKNG